MHALTRQTAWAIGLLLAFVGLVGFISPGWVGPHGLLGFEPNTTRNLFYIAVGAVGIFTLFEHDAFVRMYLLMAGVAFSALAIDGLVWDGHLINVFPTMGLDHYFHMFLGSLALVVSIWDMDPSMKRKIFGKR